MSKDTGGPAFPGKFFKPQLVKNTALGTEIEPEKWIPTSGMTLRDYFAAKAMQGWLSSFPSDGSHPSFKDKTDGVTTRCDALATESYAIADAMLKARNE